LSSEELKKRKRRRDLQQMKSFLHARSTKEVARVVVLVSFRLSSKWRTQNKMRADTVEDAAKLRDTHLEGARNTQLEKKEREKLNWIDQVARGESKLWIGNFIHVFNWAQWEFSNGEGAQLASLCRWKGIIFLAHQEWLTPFFAW